MSDETDFEDEDTDVNRPKPRFRKIKKWEGFGYVLDKNPQLTQEELLAIECEDLRAAARMPTEIVENIGKHMSMAQAPLREIERAAIDLIDKVYMAARALEEAGNVLCENHIEVECPDCHAIGCHNCETCDCGGS